MTHVDSPAVSLTPATELRVFVNDTLAVSCTTSIYMDERKLLSSQRSPKCGLHDAGTPAQKLKYFNFRAGKTEDKGK